MADNYDNDDLCKISAEALAVVLMNLCPQLIRMEQFHVPAGAQTECIGTGYEVVSQAIGARRVYAIECQDQSSDDSLGVMVTHL